MKGHLHVITADQQAQRQRVHLATGFDITGTIDSNIVSQALSTPSSWRSLSHFLDDIGTSVFDDALPDLPAKSVAALMASCDLASTGGGDSDSVLCAFSARIVRQESRTETMMVLGRQAAHVTKLMDTRTYLRTERRAKAAAVEFDQMITSNKVWDAPEELEGIPPDSIVAEGELLISDKHWELPHDLRLCKARFVGMGKVLLNKHMRVIKRSGDSLRAPLASLMGARFAHARAIALGRTPETIDFLSAYLQIPLGVEEPYYIIILAEVIDILPTEYQSQFRSLRKPVCRIRMGLYAIQRAGFDFIFAFILWLWWSKWVQMEEDPPVLYLWHLDSIRKS